MEQEEEEEAVTDGVTFSLSDGDGVFGVNTGRLVCMYEKYCSKNKTFQVYF